MLAIIGTVGVPACYGGFETLVENLLDENDEPLLVYCSAQQYKNQPSHYKNAQLRYINLNANGVQSIAYDMLSVLDAVKRGASTILVLGVSGALILPLVRWFTKIKVVTNIDGLEWRRDKWGYLAKRYLKLSESIAVKRSHVVVADNQAIADYVTLEYGRHSEVIAYGGDHALVSNVNPELVQNYALGLCRIEPENNVHLILEAFDSLKMPLKFVGNWDNSEYGRGLRQKYQHSAFVELLDPIYEVEALFRLRSGCAFYVHGHSAGGTNPSLVEMMHFGKTILAFDCSYNRASTEDAALFFSDVEDLKKKLALLEAKSNGGEMKSIADRRYTWKIVKEQYFALFD
ncbi:DUF1972 domain-containing protein [Corallincola luteus]|uniref:DUF1972 domain-containing protein n=1 Tax=Corallincola luteus TaxID=1775177 RepID=A0ABY2AQF6_9GAMM|nr:DUF1972 domain-containing protein [Corallincola luteus]TCI05433.1 DUF1972 domain-containing protein [Corallincola luteus]